MRWLFALWTKTVPSYGPLIPEPLRSEPPVPEPLRGEPL